MNLNKPLGMKSVVLVTIVTFFVIFFAAKLGLGATNDKSGINDAMSFILATFSSVIMGTIVGLMVVFGKKR